MIWFKHDSNAASNAKIKKLILKYGAEGYAIYFHCIELITEAVSDSNITFQLEHDSEIIADNLKIKGNSNQSGIDRVNEIMRYILSLNLFEENNGKITCYKLLKRLDLSMTSNQKMRNLITIAKNNHDTVMINHDTVMQEKKRKEENRKEENRKDNNTHAIKQKKPIKHRYGEYKNVLLSDDEYTKLKQCLDVVKMIKKLDEGIELKGYKYKSHYLAILKWNKDDETKTAATPEQKIEYTEFIPDWAREALNEENL
ncbi:MAG: DUF4373 domain-containing protein [Spirochaetota bacterium]|nr:DUF4373 domain-containing protein [Spirochaetota bacterium]